MFTKELLIEEYKLNKRSPQQIIKEYGGSETTIYRDMKKYGIKRRSSSENQLSENFKEPTKEELIRLHDKEHKSKNEIAKIFNVSWGAIDRRFKKFDLKGKSISEIRLPKSFIEPSEQELKELINKKKLSPVQIGRIYNISPPTVRKLCREKGIILKKTGKRFPHGYWDKEKVIKEIQKIKNEKGDLSARVCSLNRRPLFKAAIKCFKSWENAIIESGIDYNKILKQKKWTKKEIIDEIKKLYKKGAIISHKNMRKIRKDIVFSAERYFRTYANAVISAGIDYYGKIAIIKNKYWTDERIVHKIKEIHKKGISLSSRLIQLEYSDLFAVACKRFGSWEEAVFKSGISYKEITNRKYKHECDDGTRVSSIPEMQFCNRLMKNKTGYEYETLFSSKRKYTTDFKVGRFNFEVLGWWNHKDENRRIEYRERYKDKIKHWISEKGARFIYCFGHEIDKYLPYIKTSKMPVVIGVIPKDNQFKERDLNKILNPLIKLKLIN